MMKKLLLLPFFFLLVACQSTVSSTDFEDKGTETTSVTIKLVEYSNGAVISNYDVKIVSPENKLDYIVQTDDSGQVKIDNLLIGSDVRAKVENDFSSEILDIQVNKANEEFLLHWYPKQIRSLPVVMQNPTLPHGCEVTSLTAVLNYFGDVVTKEQMADQYLPKENLETTAQGVVGPDPNRVYVGNPREQTGKYIFSEGIIDTLEAYMNDIGAAYKFDDVSGKLYQYLKYYVDNGIPLVIWQTIDYGPPKYHGGWQIKESSEYHKALLNVHAVVLMAMDEEKVTIMDPLKGIIEKDTNTFMKAYQYLGRHAVAVYR